MVEVFDKTQEQEFIAWLKQHKLKQQGFYLNQQERKDVMMLHKVDCYHLNPDEGGKTTAKKKAVADNRQELLTWAEEEGVTIRICSDCKLD